MMDRDRADARGVSRAVARLCIACVVVALAAGCTPARNMTLTGVPEPARAFVTDATPPDNYPGFGAAEGNIYSCRYGIALQRAEEFIPPKARMFEALLAAEWPELQSREVVLHRFDVYANRRLKLLSQAGGMIGGIIGGSISSAANRATGTQVFQERLVVHVDPDPAFVPDDENPIGCNGRGEGEYFASQVSAGHSVIVTWLRFDVDGAPYHFRTFYPHQEDEGDDVERAKLEAVRLSVAAVVEHMRGSPVAGR